MKQTVTIYDTTLRDGTQAEGVNFSVSDKLRIAEKLDAFGVHYIEGGWPGSNPKDLEFFAEAKKHHFKHARVTAFGSTRRPHTQAEKDAQVNLLLEAHTPTVCIFGKSWLLHVREALKTTPEENLAMISDTISFLKSKKKEVIYDAEHFFDGYKDDSEYALRTLSAAAEAGADYLVLCDTNGGSLPSEVSAITFSVVASLPDAKIGIHTHDDAGMGVANALAAIEAGALQVQGTINGYGERTGNCNLTTVIPNLVLKLKKNSIPAGNLKHLCELSAFVDDLANMRPNVRAPYVGAASFAHKGGIHVSAVQKNARSYEHIDPAQVGNKQRVLVSELSGRSNVLVKAQELGFHFDKDDPRVKDILQELKKLEHEGYEFEAADASFELLIKKILQHRKPFFDLIEYHVSMRKKAQDAGVCEATIKLSVKGEVEHVAAEGDGPVNALDNALRAALVKFYPSIKDVKLTDYKVRILESKTGTAAKTRVLIESTDGKSEWGTVGVSDNIIDASWHALVDSIEYKLFKDQKKS
jgi:2-isopropylmalate synthase